MDCFYVYVHLRKDTMTPFYVGKGSGDRAFSTDGRNSYWLRVAKKYGYVVDLIGSNLQESDAFELERKTITSYRAQGFNLCNMTDGGEGLSNPSLETRQKIAQSMKGNQRTKGQKRGLETRQKMSAARKGKPSRVGFSHSEKTKQAIAATNRATYKANGREDVMRDLANQRWSDPVFREKTRQAMRESAAKRDIPRGASHPRSDLNVYRFMSPSGEIFKGTRYEISDQFGVDRYGIGFIVTGKRKSFKGWRLA
jgi:hypothetical protein